MALFTILRASSSVAPVAIRAAGAARTLRGTISTSLTVESSKLLNELSRRSSVLSNHFSTVTAKKLSSDDSLIPIINSEIKCAEESDLHDCVVEIPDSFPFEIQDKSGERTIVLRRKYQNEIIKVEVDMSDTGSEEDGDDNDGEVDNDKDESNIESSIPLVVSVSKGNGLCLQFDVRAFPDEISIHSLSIKQAESTGDQLAYEGPEFSDLEENLQKAFHKYLEIRGLKPRTAYFLLEYMISKDSKEYLRWLKKLKKFVEN